MINYERLNKLQEKLIREEPTRTQKRRIRWLLKASWGYNNELTSSSRRDKNHRKSKRHPKERSSNDNSDANGKDDDRNKEGPEKDLACERI